LAERFSTDLTSLAEREDRLAVVVDMVVGDDGSIRKSDVYRAVVCSRAKLACNARWLDGIAPVPSRIAAVAGLDEQLRVQDLVAQAMKALRHQHGALSLQTIAARASPGSKLTKKAPRKRAFSKHAAERLSAVCSQVVQFLINGADEKPYTAITDECGVAAHARLNSVGRNSGLHQSITNGIPPLVHQRPIMRVIAAEVDRTVDTDLERGILGDVLGDFRNLAFLRSLDVRPVIQEYHVPVFGPIADHANRPLCA
jgi:hypothetical protein